MMRARRLLRSRVGSALAPHWGALLALALFLVVGLAVLDDYGVAVDEAHQRLLTLQNVEFARGDADALPRSEDRYYGLAFELPILLTEHALGVEIGRGVYLFRHLQTHLFFLAGGLFAYLLAFQLFRSRLLAVIAMLLFLLHPRLYAHSFFNSKDLPFLVMFIVTLYLTHRAFKKDTLSAFALLGVGAGLLVNARIMGVVLFAAIPALRALDFAFARGWAERKRILLTTGAFALASALIFYALLPYLWADPVGRAVEWWATFSDHPYVPTELFRGTLYLSVDLPAEYLPVWIVITSAPFALLLGLIGATTILTGAAGAPADALLRRESRFAALLLFCFFAPVLAVILLNANIYDGWRQMHFLWAPFALLAVYGLQWLAQRVRVRSSLLAVYGATGLGLIAVVVSMALIHPNQQVYFNFSTDRVAPERLRTQYAMEYWGHSTRQALQWILDEHPGSPVEALVGVPYIDLEENLRIFPSEDAERLSPHPSLDAFLVRLGEGERPDLTLHRVQAYGNTIASVERRDHLKRVYDAALQEEIVFDSVYDVYRLGDDLILVKEPCLARYLTEHISVVRVTPLNADDLPYWERDAGLAKFQFGLDKYGAFFDGKCVASLPLPDYPIADFSVVWRPELPDHGAARESMRRAKEEGQLLARSAYDLYLANGELVYVQEQCDPLDTEPTFRVSVFPQRVDDLPEEWRERGYERFWFNFHWRGALLEEGACVALFPLPDYPIAAIRTAQYIEGGDDLWEAAFSVNPERYAAAYRAVDGSEPVARGAFDVHLLDGDLVYVKEPCEQADTEARFFLHVVPERVSDLPEARREWGFDNLDFAFFLNGAWFDGKCAARVPLPPYPVESIRTGQYVSGVGEIWRAEFLPSPDGGRGQPRSGG